MNITKEVKVNHFNLDILKDGMLIKIEDNSEYNYESYKKDGLYFVKSVTEELLKVINYEGTVYTFSPDECMSKYPLDMPPCYEITIISE